MNEPGSVVVRGAMCGLDLNVRGRSSGFPCLLGQVVPFMNLRCSFAAQQSTNPKPETFGSKFSGGWSS